MYAAYENKTRKSPVPQSDKGAEPTSVTPGTLPRARTLQRELGNSYLYKVAESGRQEDARLSVDYTKKGPAPGSTSATAGGITGTTLDVTFTVSGEPAAGLQCIQTFWGTRRTDGLQVGTMTWTENKKTYDAFVDGGVNSPYVTLGGNPPAHATMPYYLTADEVKNQVTFSKDSGTIKIYDLPGAIAAHDEAYFETAVIAINHNASGKDKVLKAFDWGWTGKGTTSTVGKGTPVAGKDSGINIKGSVSTRFTDIVKHDYSSYTLT